MPIPPIYAAPLQGYTDYIWRNAHAAVFGNIQCYFSSFLRIEHGSVRRKDLRDIAPENNANTSVVPQLLACEPEKAMAIANTIVAQGYKHIDINLGCPFAAIARRHQGAGMLPYPVKVAALLKALSQVEGVTFSIKMRLGMTSEHEWEDILPLLDIIKPTHLTVHPRTGEQQYKGDLFAEQFGEIYQRATCPVIYNGDVCSLEQINAVQQYPNLLGIMIGRGLLANPALHCPELLTADNMQRFHQLLFTGNANHLEGGDHQVLTKMLTYWKYLLPEADHRLRKKVLKSTSIAKYQSAVSELISSL